MARRTQSWDLDVPLMFSPVRCPFCLTMSVVRGARKQVFGRGGRRRRCRHGHSSEIEEYSTHVAPTTSVKHSCRRRRHRRHCQDSKCAFYLSSTILSHTQSVSLVLNLSAAAAAIPKTEWTSWTTSTSATTTTATGGDGRDICIIKTEHIPDTMSSSSSSRRRIWATIFALCSFRYGSSSIIIGPIDGSCLAAHFGSTEGAAYKQEFREISPHSATVIQLLQWTFFGSGRFCSAVVRSNRFHSFLMEILAKASESMVAETVSSVARPPTKEPRDALTFPQTFFEKAVSRTCHGCLP